MTYLEKDVKPKKVYFVLFVKSETIYCQKKKLLALVL